MSIDTLNMNDTNPDPESGKQPINDGSVNMDVREIDSTKEDDRLLWLKIIQGKDRPVAKGVLEDLISQSVEVDFRSEGNVHLAAN